MVSDEPIEVADEPIRWTKSGSWLPRINSILNAMFGPRATLRLQEVDVAGLYEDDPDWVSIAAKAAHASEERLVAAIAEGLASCNVRVFHGTRTADARSFISHGIKLHDRQEMESLVRSLVQRATDLNWLEPTLDSRFAETSHLTDHGRCYVVADERVLIEECGHYLLGGSEFLQGILGPCRAQSLFESCAPTVVEVDLPLRWVSESQQLQFASKLIGEWARLSRLACEKPRRLDFTFVLCEAVPASWIVGHFHPAVVYDPHRMRRPVRSKITSCDACVEALEPNS